ncbi:hypothetical protein M9Y10_031687 [Tritrichomonas musculus]|uniref:Leucine Rich Repeat family protein n=1 Tax=Tritrichomonas musculus TaxID=1915356 RepID=A0ABR2H1D7_9EUKA
MSKTVDLSTVNLPYEMPNISKEKIFFSKWIDKISTKGKRNQRLLIITDWEFFILKKKRFSKKFTLSYSFKWVDITAIESNDASPYEFSIYFQKTHQQEKRPQQIQSSKTKKMRVYFKFRYQKTQKMLMMLYNYLSSFKLNDDLPEFKYPSSFAFPKVKTSIPEIIRMKLRLNNYRISNSTLNAIKKFLSSHPTHFCFTEIRSLIKNLPIFLKYIYLEPSIKTFVIPFNVDFNILKILNNFLKENKTITSLIFKEKLPLNFSNFKSTFLSSSSTQMIQSFKFINSKFSIQNVKDISKIVKKRNVKSLQIINSLGPLSMPPFVYNIYNNPGFQKIEKLTIDHTNSIDIRKMMPYLQNVISLTLTDCRFQIADLFAMLIEDYQMEYLNISLNINDKRIFDEIIFPKFLSVLVVCGIEWDELSLKMFFESIMVHKPEANNHSLHEDEIILDLSHSSMKDDDWELFFQQLESIPRGNVIKFKWNDNPIDKRLISFFDSFVNLKSLSLDGCIIKNNDDLLNLLQFICRSKTLEYLSFAGTEMRNMKRQILSVIDTLYINRSIKKINVSNHNCGNSILIKLGQVLLENRVVEEVYIDDNNITDIFLYQQF